MKYLIRTVETYRVDTENEAKQLIEEAKKNGSFTLSKYSTEFKTTKAKGEIIDSWYRTTLTKDFTSEKEPEYTTRVYYNVDPTSFPTVRETTEEVDSDDENGGVEF